jgi:hypothetical protein
MSGDNPPDVGKSDAGALELGRVVKALEFAEESTGLGGVESDPVVANEEG